MATNRIHIRAPAIDRVAILAAGAELTPMDVSVAISALMTNVSKNFSQMAGITRDILMQATQWVLSFPIVVKFDSLPDGRPTRRGVAVLASDSQRPMRVLHARRFAGLGNQHSGACQQRCKHCKQAPRPAHRPSPASADFSCSSRPPVS